MEEVEEVDEEIFDASEEKVSLFENLTEGVVVDAFY
jgi:hypothetical protein